MLVIDDGSPPGDVERRAWDPAQVLTAGRSAASSRPGGVSARGRCGLAAPYFGSASSRPTAARNAGSAKIPVTL